MACYQPIPYSFWATQQFNHVYSNNTHFIWFLLYHIDMRICIIYKFIWISVIIQFTNFLDVDHLIDAYKLIGEHFSFRSYNAFKWWNTWSSHIYADVGVYVYARKCFGFLTGILPSTYNTYLCIKKWLLKMCII